MTKKVYLLVVDDDARAMIDRSLLEAIDAFEAAQENEAAMDPRFVETALAFRVLHVMLSEPLMSASDADSLLAEVQVAVEAKMASVTVPTSDPEELFESTVAKTRHTMVRVLRALMSEQRPKPKDAPLDRAREAP